MPKNDVSQENVLPVKIGEFEVYLDNFTSSKSGKTFKILRVMCMGEDITTYFVDGKVKLILKLLGHNISDEEILENVEKNEK